VRPCGIPPSRPGSVRYGRRRAVAGRGHREHVHNLFAVRQQPGGPDPSRLGHRRGTCARASLERGTGVRTPAWLALQGRRIWTQHGPSRTLLGPMSQAANNAGPQGGDFSAGSRLQARMNATIRSLNRAAVVIGPPGGRAGRGRDRVPVYALGRRGRACSRGAGAGRVTVPARVTRGADRTSDSAAPRAGPAGTRERQAGRLFREHALATRRRSQPLRRVRLDAGARTRHNRRSGVKCPRWESNPHCDPFKGPASAVWATGAQPFARVAGVSAR
jgi:hypothetical protein